MPSALRLLPQQRHLKGQTLSCPKMSAMPLTLCGSSGRAAPSCCSSCSAGFRSVCATGSWTHDSFWAKEEMVNEESRQWARNGHVEGTNL